MESTTGIFIQLEQLPELPSSLIKQSAQPAELLYAAGTPPLTPASVIHCCPLPRITRGDRRPDVASPATAWTAQKKQHTSNNKHQQLKQCFDCEAALPVASVDRAHVQQWRVGVQGCGGLG